MKDIIQWLEEMLLDAQAGKENLLDWIETEKNNIRKKEAKLLKHNYKIESIKEAIEKLRKSE